MLLNLKESTMKNKIFIAAGVLCIATIVFSSFAGCSRSDGRQPEGNEYYFDSAAADGGDGSEKFPYNDLSYIDSLKLNGGDSILLKAGSVFFGSLALKNISGSSESPVTVSYYGNAEEYGMPKVDGDGSEGAGVLYIENCSWLTVKDIELYDSAVTEGDRRGVLINLTNPGGDDVMTYSGITLSGLYIHDIRGITDAENSGMSAESKSTGGIHVWSVDGHGRTDGLTIAGCRIDDVDNVGIATWYKPGTGGESKVSPYRDDFDIYAHSNLHIVDNEISRIGKNGIFARNLYGGVIEWNTLYETAITCVSGNTIVTSYVYGTVVQYNEGYYNRATVRPSDGKVQDGCMLDADLQSRDTVWQFNYSHDNAFGLFLNCTSYDPDNGIEDRVIVRYNLSVHDHGNKGIVYINYVTAGIEVYNNTFIVSAETSPIILKSNTGRKFSFYNNIIYNLSADAELQIADTVYAEIGNNIVYNSAGASIKELDEFKEENLNGLYVDPLFEKNYSDSFDRIGRAFAENFKLDEDSPAFAAAAETDYKGEDFFGSPYKNCIGFYCGV